jgi:hypothetical protein
VAHTRPNRAIYKWKVWQLLLILGIRLCSERGAQQQHQQQSYATRHCGCNAYVYFKQQYNYRFAPRDQQNVSFSALTTAPRVFLGAVELDYQSGVSPALEG